MNIGKKLTGGHFLALSFFILIIVGMLLLKLPVSSHTGTSWTDALFTATSAVCVTGLIVVDTPVHFTFFGQMVILVLIQFGGIGIMTFAAYFVFIFNKKLSLPNRIMMESSFAQESSQIKLSGLLKFIVRYTFIFEVAGVVFFMLFLNEANFWKRFYFSVFHAVSAFCNAGFSTYSNSLMNYNDNAAVNITTMILIIAGGIGFLVAFEIRSKIKEILFKKRKIQKFKNYYTFSLHTWLVLLTSGILIFSGAILIYFIELYSGSGTTYLQSLFQSVTARTAGFNTIDIATLNKGTQMIIVALMFIGGSPGSAAGGIKTTTFAIIVSMIIIGRNNFEDIVIRNRQLTKRTVFQALTVFTFAFAIVFATVILVMIFDSQHEGISIIFESVSAFGTVGLSTGITSELNMASKFVITFAMFCGRVGPLTIFSIFLLKAETTEAYASDRVLTG